MGLNSAINNPVFDRVIYSLTSLNGDFSTHRLFGRKCNIPDICQFRASLSFAKTFNV